MVISLFDIKTGIQLEYFYKPKNISVSRVCGEGWPLALRALAFLSFFKL